MASSAPETAWILLSTVMRGAALSVLATEALFLWTRRREPAAPGTAAQLLGRVFWAATPAVLLAGLALWCLAALGDAQAQHLAQLTSR